ncbi:MAG: hypothetical protein ACKVHP_06685 [Verrucomicrobiales bacterium]
MDREASFSPRAPEMVEMTDMASEFEVEGLLSKLVKRMPSTG